MNSLNCKNTIYSKALADIFLNYKEQGEHSLRQMIAHHFPQHCQFKYDSQLAVVLINFIESLPCDQTKNQEKVIVDLIESFQKESLVLEKNVKDVKTQLEFLQKVRSWLNIEENNIQSFKVVEFLRHIYYYKDECLQDKQLTQHFK